MKSFSERCDIPKNKTGRYKPFFYSVEYLECKTYCITGLLYDWNNLDNSSNIGDQMHLTLEDQDSVCKSDLKTSVLFAKKLR